MGGLLLAVAIVLVVIAAAASGLNYYRSQQRLVERAATLTGGNPSRGSAAILHYGCGSCHTIPGVRAARGLVGPPLDGISDRIYLGGVLYNTPENMLLWIRAPRQVDPLTAMPDLGVSEEDARDIAAFLYMLH